MVVLGVAALVVLLGLVGCGGNDAGSTELSIVGGEVGGYAFEGDDVARVASRDLR